MRHGTVDKVAIVRLVVPVALTLLSPLGIHWLAGGKDSTA